MSGGEGRLHGRAALVTGAASGIGAATSRLFAAEGAAVLLADLDEAGAAAVAAELGERGQGAWSSHVDVTDEGSTQALAALARQAMGQLDVVVANAGVLARGACADTSAAELEAVLRVNLLGAHNTFRAALPLVRAAPEGVLLATTSLASSHGSAGLGAYAASKFALLGLLQSLAQEEAAHGVRVCGVAPGFVPTAMLGSMLESSGDPDPERLAAELAAKVALGRLGRPEEVAEAFAFLASPQARYVTGANLAVDGGYRF